MHIDKKELILKSLAREADSENCALSLKNK